MVLFFLQSKKASKDIIPSSKENVARSCFYFPASSKKSEIWIWIEIFICDGGKLFFAVSFCNFYSVERSNYLNVVPIPEGIFAPIFLPFLPRFFFCHRKLCETPRDIKSLSVTIWGFPWGVQQFAASFQPQKKNLWGSFIERLQLQWSNL